MRSRFAITGRAKKIEVKVQGAETAPAASETKTHETKTNETKTNETKQPDAETAAPAGTTNTETKIEAATGS
jgi:hypothetical protein